MIESLQCVSSICNIELSISYLTKRLGSLLKSLLSSGARVTTVNYFGSWTEEVWCTCFIRSSHCLLDSFYHRCWSSCLQIPEAFVH